MSHPESEILALMAMGESVASAEDRAHVEGCPGCLEELAALTHAVTVGRATIDVGDLERPDARVWSRIADELDLGDDARALVASPPRLEPTPALGSATASVAHGMPRRSRRHRPGRSRFRGRALLAAALAFVVGVGAIAWAVSRPPAATPVAEASLDALPDHPGARGSAVVDRGRDGGETVTVTLTAPAAPGGYHEVWLLTPDASRLVSLGTLDGDEGTFPIPPGVDLGEYSLVDISDEPVDGDPTHSGDSIVRGALTSL